MNLPAGLRITFIGHSSFKIDTPTGPVIYIDAWLRENPACPEALKAVEKADLFLVTHGHSDHLDADLADWQKATGARIVAPSAVMQYLRTKEVANLEFLNMGGSVELCGARITMTLAFHAAHINTPEGPAYPHDTIGYVLEFGDGFSIYHAGDTGLFGDMKLIGDLYHPTVAMLPIGDRATMGPFQAAHAVRMLQPKAVIPMHYGTFPFLPGTAEEFGELIRDVKGTELKVMKPGDVWGGSG